MIITSQKVKHHSLLTIHNVSFHQLHYLSCGCTWSYPGDKDQLNYITSLSQFSKPFEHKNNSFIIIVCQHHSLLPCSCASLMLHHRISEHLLQPYSYNILGGTLDADQEHLKTLLLMQPNFRIALLVIPLSWSRFT